MGPSSSICARLFRALLSHGFLDVGNYFVPLEHDRINLVRYVRFQYIYGRLAVIFYEPEMTDCVVFSSLGTALLFTG